MSPAIGIASSWCPLKDPLWKVHHELKSHTKIRRNSLITHISRWFPNSRKVFQYCMQTHHFCSISSSHFLKSQTLVSRGLARGPISNSLRCPSNNALEAQLCHSQTPLASVAYPHVLLESYSQPVRYDLGSTLKLLLHVMKIIENFNSTRDLNYFK